MFLCKFLDCLCLDAAFTFSRQNKNNYVSVYIEQFHPITNYFVCFRMQTAWKKCMLKSASIYVVNSAHWFIYVCIFILFTFSVCLIQCERSQVYNQHIATFFNRFFSFLNKKKTSKSIFISLLKFFELCCLPTTPFSNAFSDSNKSIFSKQIQNNSLIVHH